MFKLSYGELPICPTSERCIQDLGEFTPTAQLHQVCPTRVWHESSLFRPIFSYSTSSLVSATVTSELPMKLGPANHFQFQDDLRLFLKLRNVLGYFESTPWSVGSIELVNRACICRHQGAQTHRNPDLRDRL